MSIRNTLLHGAAQLLRRAQEAVDTATNHADGVEKQDLSMISITIGQAAWDLEIMLDDE